MIAANVQFGVTNGAAADLSELAAAVNGTSGKTGVTASLSIDKSTMTLISDDGYDVVVENYQLVGVTGPTMNISGADEDFNDLTDGTTQFSDAATDFYTIDRRFGTNQDYKSLVEEAHKAGIKVIMDVVHNHVGDKHPWFSDPPNSTWFNNNDKFSVTN